MGVSLQIHAHARGQQTTPESRRNPASRHSRCSAHRRGSERACGSGTGQTPPDATRRAKAYKSTRTAASSSTEHAHNPGQHHNPGIMLKPGIPAQQMHEPACRIGTGENPLAEHAQHAPQPRSIAWEGGREAAMKGGAPWLCERASGRVPAPEAPMSLLFTGKKPRG